MTEIAASDPAIARVYESYTAFADEIAPWMLVSRRAHVGARDA
jgi:TRAP-type mannitol/chloroaromatic compound transport system substrate-binding protein